MLWVMDREINVSVDHGTTWNSGYISYRITHKEAIQSQGALKGMFMWAFGLSKGSSGQIIYVYIWLPCWAIPWNTELNRCQIYGLVRLAMINLCWLPDVAKKLEGQLDAPGLLFTKVGTHWTYAYGQHMQIWSCSEKQEEGFLSSEP